MKPKHLKPLSELLHRPPSEPLSFTRRSLELTPPQWAALDAIAAQTGSRAPTGPATGQPAWRTLIKRIATGALVVSAAPAAEVLSALLKIGATVDLLTDAEYAALAALAEQCAAPIEGMK